MYYPQQLSQYCGSQYMAPPPSLKGRPVTSLDEVRAANIDFDGSLFIFPDIANKKIYTKQINLDGTATLNQYELAPTPAPDKPTYITREEFESALNEFKAQFGEKEVASKKKETIPVF